MPTQADLDHLFQHLWPAMHGAAAHHAHCSANLTTINSVFAIHTGNVGDLLRALNGLHGVGPTIASGLIYSAHRNQYVPFDMYTMGHALQLRLVASEWITRGNNYRAFSRAIVNHIKQAGLQGGIEGFVREAGQRCQFPYSPK